MKNLIKIIFIIILTASCSDYLNLTPIDRPSNVTFLANEGELNIALAGCYNPLWTLTDGACPFYIILETISDIGSNRIGGGATVLIPNGSVTSDNSYFLGRWREFYAAVTSCNFLLENMDRAKEKTNPDNFKRIAAEARFLRAFYYSFLNELWGGVPLITKILNYDEAEIPRSTKAEVTDFILNELKEAAIDLPWEYAASERGRATKGAALALHSRIALYNERWDDAISSASQIMEANKYTLYNNFRDLFIYAGEDANEIIFAIQFQRGGMSHSIPIRYLTRMGLGTSERFPSLSLTDSYECTDGLSIDVSPLYQPLNPELNRDPRLGYTVVMPNTIFIGYQFETHPDSVLCWDYNVTPPRRVANQDAINPFATATGFLWKKYVDPIDRFDFRNSELNFTLLRYAEVLLNYAEAKIEKGVIDQSVYDAINAIRTRPSVNMPVITTGKTQAEMRSIIRKERKYELAGEGLRIFDVRRWKIGESAMHGNFYGRPKIKGKTNWMNEPPSIDEWGTPDYSNISNKADLRILSVRNFNKDRDYIWPIPKLELETNKALVQNPNW